MIYLTPIEQRWDSTDVRYRMGSGKRSPLSSITAHSSELKGDISIEVVSEEGPAIVPSFGRVGKDIPFNKDATTDAGLVVGGRECRNANSMDFYGTICFTGPRISWSVEKGPCHRQECTVDDFLASNNHVIARSDSGREGEVIWTNENADEARLACFVGLSCKAHVDFAIARINDPNPGEYWMVQQIGRLTNLRRMKKSPGAQPGADIWTCVRCKSEKVKKRE